MSDVRSARLAGPLLLSDGPAAVVYTAPGGRVVLVKSMRFANLTTGPVELDVELTPFGGAAVPIWPSADIPSGAIVWDTSWFVLHAGDTLAARCDPDGALSLIISGAVLTA